MTQEILNYLQNYFIAFLFLLERFTLLFFIFPLFTTAYLPARIKVALSLILSLALVPVIKLNIPFPDSPLALFFLLLSDFLIFFLLSLFLRFILAGIQVGGEMVGLQMGFGISQTIDPISGVSIPILSEFLFLLLLLFFFTLDFHHHLLTFVVYSFDYLPPGLFLFKQDLLSHILKKSGLIFDLSLRVLGPMLLFMLLVYVVLAIVGRFIPQMNVMFVSFPLTLGLGLIIFGLMLLFLPKVLTTQLSAFKSFTLYLLKAGQ
jgi:flagellar biosynthetic protein FliR